MERLLTEAAAERGIRVQAIGAGPNGRGWILRFTRARDHATSGASVADAGTDVRHAHGFCLDLNPAATHLLAMDKAGTSDALAAAGVPSIEHRVFLHPRLGPYVPRSGNWTEMLAFAEAHGFDVVAKDNTGTGGYGVRRVRTARDLERAAYDLFQRTHAVALCPFADIEAEVRFVILNGTIELAYSKERLRVEGDGVSTVLELLARAAADAGPARARLSRLLAEGDEHTLPTLATVPAPGESALLNWRHNLGQGAAATRISDPMTQVPTLARVALDAAAAIGLVFGSVDVVMVRDRGGSRGAGAPAGTGTAKVLEVNAGVMMEALAQDSAEGESIARAIYARALDAMFARR
jgi:glutathione synthase/RimK-type ligase-like ATP-grasp enzyme